LFILGVAYCFLLWLEALKRLIFLPIIMRIQKSGDQFSITLPKKIIEAMDWGKGDNIEIKISGKNKLELVRS